MSATFDAILTVALWLILVGGVALCVLIAALCLVAGRSDAAREEVDW